MHRSKHTKKHYRVQKPERGFTLLIAVLVSSILLALGFAIFNIAAKEVVLSASGRESQFAFYAADSGIECALYWDYEQDAFSATSPRQPECAGGETTNYNVDFDADTGVYTTTFSFSLEESLSGPCTDVTVTRRTDPTRTIVVAAGYNTCVTTNPRRIERAIRVQY
ncbi:MAG: pilus assembly PilX N-terminal domain-containing protein [Patescibacteria group bacterium UBA2163]